MTRVLQTITIVAAFAAPGAIASDPYGPAEIATAKLHPDCDAHTAMIRQWFRRAPEQMQDSPGRMIQCVDFAAQLHALTGEFPAAARPILRRVRNEWPLALANFNHVVTLDVIPALYRAAKLSPVARSELIIPFRWLEGRMLDAPPVGFPNTSLLASNPFVGLRAMVMLRDVLYGSASAREVAFQGFGPSPAQWGLCRLFAEGFDAHGLPVFDVGRFNHHAWTSRAAMVWLVRRFNLYHRLTSAEKATFTAFYAQPIRLLCVGGQSFVLPGFNDEYAMQPILGPAESWTGDTIRDQWARHHARRYQSRTFDWLLLPADAGYVPTERPPGGSGNRDFGTLKIVEQAGVSIVTFTPLAAADINGRPPRVAGETKIIIARSAERD